jgi:hypothetical protein
MLPLQLGPLTPVVSDPLSVVLIVVAVAILGGASAVFGYLSLRGVVAAVAPE